MNKQLVAVLLLLGLALCPIPAQAHPPKTPEVFWDAGTHTLTVKARHTVSDPAKHHITALVVLNNKDETLTTKQYTRQTSAQSFSDTVQLKGTLPGDLIKVRLICNIMGTTETSVTLK